MRPLILQYRETTKNQNFDFSGIAYSEKLNLTIDTKTGLPAIDYLSLSTETFTRTYDETSDSDNDRMSLMMSTVTKTSYQLEGTDEDPTYSFIKMMMETKTLTLVAQEGSDNDR